MDVLYGIFSLTQSEHQSSWVARTDLELDNIIHSLHGKATVTDANAVYNVQDTVENNILIRTSNNMEVA